MRNIDPLMDGEVVRAIDGDLDALVNEQGVNILWAIESGSRAWGFPSPDSDYDCRFIYTRPMEQMLALKTPRDVIELPLTPVFDINGWELKKALQLLKKGNAVIIEWLHSEIIYRGNDQFSREFLQLAEQIVDRGLIANHYWHLAVATHKRHADGSEDIALKKLFYILRPLMALDWLNNHPEFRLPPMNLNILRNGIDLPASLTEAVDQLLEIKKKTHEIGTGKIPKPIATYIEDHFKVPKYTGQTGYQNNAQAEKLLNNFHWRWVNQ